MELWEYYKSLNPKYETPEHLWSAAVHYFEWITANPLKEDFAYQYMGNADHDEKLKIRAMTFQGLFLFLSITRDKWLRFKANPKLANVCEAVEMVMYEQKFTGAAAGLLSTNLIARDLGLADKQIVETKQILSETEIDVELQRRGIDPTKL